jgi:hypothetical protein
MGFARDVDAGQFHELVVHRGQAPTDELRRATRRDVEVDASVGTPSSGLYFRVDRPGHFVARQ